MSSIGSRSRRGGRKILGARRAGRLSKRCDLNRVLIYFARIIIIISSSSSSSRTASYRAVSAASSKRGAFSYLVRYPRVFNYRCNRGKKKIPSRRDSISRRNLITASQSAFRAFVPRKSLSASSRAAFSANRSSSALAFKFNWIFSPNRTG